MSSLLKEGIEVGIESNIDNQFKIVIVYFKKCFYFILDGAERQGITDIHLGYDSSSSGK